MSMFLVITFLFFIGSILGWIVELFYRRIVSKNWINPGFLTGPYLPIYGIGLSTLFLISMVDVSSIHNVILQKVTIVALMTIMMTLIEYIGGIVFIKGMKIKLWDYSNRFGNIQGIICPFFSIIWGIAGAIYYFFIHEHIIDFLIWFSNNLAFSFVVGFFFGILIIDLCNTLHIVSKFKEFADENKIYLKFEEIKDYIRESQKKAEEKINYIFAFKSNRSIKDVLTEYFDKIKEHKN